MSFCPADCSDIVLTNNPDNNCTVVKRTRNVDRWMMFTCDTMLPQPLTEAGLQALVDANKLVFTSPLSQVDVQDPTYNENEIADCEPIDEFITSRIVAFQDRVAIDIPADGTVSPPVTAVPFYNYDFWKDKLNKKVSLRYAAVYCDGSVIVIKNPTTGQYLSGSLRAYVKQEKQGSGNDRYWIEYIQGQINFFGGDPFDLGNKPELNASNEVIDISGWGFY